ncbi:hypothetical protein WH5701_11824 [Synechococcus sp. WH 5701]|nr:hypothetical protein WH5701_11824 [Synechococcus sp. WH 5701]
MRAPTKAATTISLSTDQRRAISSQPASSGLL